MKAWIAEFSQETNSFSPIVSTLDYFKAGQFCRGEALRKQETCGSNVVGGFLSVLDQADCDVHLGLGMRAPASGGPVEHSVVELFLQDAEAQIRELHPDIILLSLHGATQSTVCEDVCGLICRTVRDAAGAECIIAVGCDMHANVTTRELQAVDFVCGYQTYPHRDLQETGVRAAKLALRRCRGEKLTAASLYLPMIVPASGYNTDEGAFGRLIDRANGLVAAGNIADFTVFQMQPWLDVSDAGSRVIVVAETVEAAEAYATSLAKELFAGRKEFWPKLWAIEDVIRIAENNRTGQPVILVDAADSAGAGSKGDSAAVIRKLLESKSPIRAASTVCDPEAVQRAVETGVGNCAEFTFGGKFTPEVQGSVTVNAKVMSIHEGTFEIEGAANRGRKRTMGLCAVIRFGAIDVLLSTIASGSGDTQLYRHFGIEPTFYDLVVAKANTSFRVAYSAITSLFYVADTPGPATANLRSLHYRRIPEAFYPFCALDEYEPGEPEVFA